MAYSDLHQGRGLIYSQRCRLLIREQTPCPLGWANQRKPALRDSLRGGSFGWFRGRRTGLRGLVSVAGALAGAAIGAVVCDLINASDDFPG